MYGNYIKIMHLTIRLLYIDQPSDVSTVHLQHTAIGTALKTLTNQKGDLQII